MNNFKDDNFALEMASSQAMFNLDEVYKCVEERQLSLVERKQLLHVLKDFISKIQKINDIALVNSMLDRN